MDKSQAKKYTKIAVTLGVIAGGSALLIGLANIITAGPIAQNELNKKLESIKVVYGEDAKYGDEVVITEELKATYPHLISFYNAKNAEGNDIGNVFVTEGANNFGNLKMAVGVNVDNTFGKISVIQNGQTIDSFMPNVIGAWNDKGQREFIDGQVGATFGAKLVVEMANEALRYYQTEIKGEAVPTVPNYVSNIYGSSAIYGDEIKVEDTTYANIKGYYSAKGKNGNLLGYVFILEGKNDFGPIKMSIGINADGTIGKVFLIENGQTNGKDKELQTNYVDKYNKGEIDFNDVDCGATFGATLINTMGKQALNYYKAEIVKEITDFAPYCVEIFGSKAQYVRNQIVIDATNKALQEQWTAMSSASKTLGRVYHAELDGQHIMVGVNKGGEQGEEDPNKKQTLAKVFWVNKGEDEASKEALAFIEKLNKGEANLEANANDSALVKTIKTVANQAMDHADKNKITNPLDVTFLLKETFGNNSYTEHTLVDDKKFSNVVEYWNVKDQKTTKYLGRAYHLEAPGQHATLHVVVGVDVKGNFHKVASNAFAPDEAAYKAILAYIDGLNDGSLSLDKQEDTKGGATGTCSGIRELALMGIQHYANNMIVDPYLTEVFGEKVSYVDKTTLNDKNFANVSQYWNVIGKDNQYEGRVYHMALPGKHGTMHALVGVNMEGKMHFTYLINKAPNEYGDKLQRYVDNLNRGDISLQDDIHNGASNSSKGVRDLILQALSHFEANKLIPLLEDQSSLTPLFEAGSKFVDHRRVNEAAYSNVVETWKVTNGSNDTIGAAYHCQFPGKHSVMHVTVGILKSNDVTSYAGTFKKVILLNKAPNEYGDILQKYVDDLNSGKVNLEDDIHNGATSSSNAVKTMVSQALDHYNTHRIENNTVLNSRLKEVFGEEAKFSSSVVVNSLAHGNIVESWEASDAENNPIGRVYHGVLGGKHGVFHVLIGVNLDGTFHKIVWANKPVHGPEDVLAYANKAAATIEQINNGEICLTDDIHNGATSTTNGIIDLALQAMNHYSVNPIVINKGE